MSVLRWPTFPYTFAKSKVDFVHKLSDIKRTVYAQMAELA